MNKVCGIYVITCNVNNKKYVGSSTNIAQRWNSHKSLLKRGKHKNAYLQNTYNKYGVDTLEFKIIEIADKTKLEKRETFWISHYDTKNREIGYNFENPNRSQMSEETKEKIRQANTGKSFSESRKKRISESKKQIFKEQGVSDTHKEQLAKARQKGKQKVIEANKKRVWSKEQRAKHSALLKGKKKPPRTPEMKENYRKARLAYLELKNKK